LLIPKLTEGGRRIYDWHDVVRLQQILFLKPFGFSLEEIRDRLLPAESAGELERILTGQNEVLLTQISKLQELADLMNLAIKEIRSGGEIGIDKFVAIMELMRQGNPQAYILRYFGNDQVKDMLNKQDVAAFNQQYEVLCAEMMELYDKGANPTGLEGQELAARWWEMVMAFSGGNPDLLKTMFSAGADIDNWPGELNQLGNMMKEFLSPAMGLYFQTNGIELPENEVK
jgi:DNA-binding transcriptional MerR regulator